jgi:hypothetical protein
MKQSKIVSSAINTEMNCCFVAIQLRDPATGLFSECDGFGFFVDSDSAEYQLNITATDSKSQYLAVYVWNMEDEKPRFPYVFSKNEPLELQWLWDKKRLKVGRYHFTVQYYTMEDGSCLSSEFVGAFRITKR